MNYENREIPEGINVSQEHPLKEFSALLLSLVLLVVTLVVVLSLIASYVAPLVPFHLEQKIVQQTDMNWLQGEPLSEEQQVIEQYLKTLGKELAAEMELPKDMQLTIHYNNSDVVNAFATLGGHIVIHQGLLAEMPHENALAMVMAHEIAHIKNRHPIVASGRGLTVALALAAIGGFTDSSATDWLINILGTGSISSFTRGQESESDADALNALSAYYGHVNGAADLFEVLGNRSEATKLLEFFGTHPADEDRIAAIEKFARYTAQGSTTAMPEGISKELL
ncbi:MAG: M48 family metallopeptidase [Pseudomonadales bacterium]